MLLRHDPAMDDDVFNSLTGASEAPVVHHQQAQADLLDDVWGDASAPGSPNLEPGTAELYGHPSDMRRLQQEHATAGYRDGITEAKATSVQDGFDEGFGLGATIGARAGQLLGLLEGIASALWSAEEGTTSAAVTRLAEAKKDLSAQAIFSPQYWGPDGTWTYAVPAADGTEAGVVFADVAAAHPLVNKWEEIVKADMERWGIKLSVLAGGSLEDIGPGPESNPRGDTKATVTKSREALIW